MHALDRVLSEAATTPPTSIDTSWRPARRRQRCDAGQLPGIQRGKLIP